MEKKKKRKKTKSKDMKSKKSRKQDKNRRITYVGRLGACPDYKYFMRI